MIHAQTILQLYNQLRSDFGSRELRLLRSTYEFSARIFCCRYTASGRSFLAHGVGTASVLGSLRLPVEVVAAGLLHNAYQNGDFGFGPDRALGGKRGVVARNVGKRVEQYVFGFSQLRWNSEAITALRCGINLADDLQRHVILIRLADMLDHHLDSGLGYLGQQGSRAFVVRSADAMIELADDLGYPTLALRLGQAFDAVLAGNPPIELDDPLGRASVTLLAPPSFRKQYHAGLIQHAWKHGRRLARFLRARLQV